MAVPRAVSRGWPVSIEMAATMPGPPRVVWELITDWEHQDDWMLEASEFVVLSSHREGIGVEAGATVKIAGITTRDKVRVTGWEPNRRLAIAHEGWVSGRGEFYLTPLGEDRTHVFWREELEPPLGLLGAVGLTGFKPIMKRIFTRDLRIVAGLVRARAKTGRAARA